MKSLEIFKAGNHVTANGQQLTFSEAELVASANAYDPKLHEAPIVIGHPKHDDPAYGWIGGVRVDGSSYFADPKQVDLEFAEAVKAGKFKKISASFYAPDSPSNPVQGVYYLRHVGFLGAMPPSVKGMAPVNFAEAEEGVVEFGEVDFMDWDDMTIAGLFSNLREWMISKFDVETADRVVPIYAIDELKMSAAKDDMPEKSMDYSEGEQPVTIDFAEREATLAAREAAIAKREAELTKIEFSEYCDKLIGEGKVFPHEKSKIVATLIALAKSPDVVEFAEGDGTKSESLLQTYKASLEARIKQVDFAEIPQGVDPIDFSDGNEIGAKATEYIEAQKAQGKTVSPIEAVQFVVGNR